MARRAHGGPDEWARRAEARGFSTLGTIDRIVYGNYEPLTYESLGCDELASAPAPPTPPR